jgi:transposase InsO family protein
MDYHQNARLTIYRREQLARKVVEEKCTLKLAAASFGVSAKTTAKWVRRYRELGPAGLRDRSSRPGRMPRQTCFSFVERVLLLRRQRWTGCRIAETVGLSRATISRILCRNRLSRMRDLEPRPPVHRYEHKAPGDLLHLDIKKLGRFTAPGARAHGDLSRRTRGVGWDYVHVAIDDHSRIAFSAIHPNEQGSAVTAFLRAAVADYARLGIRVRRLLTDNGPAYRSLAFARACAELGLKHRFTRPYTPRTNGKAERFIQTALREWAYARAYDSSQHRNRDLLPWLHQYNWHRPHGGIGLAAPISRSGLDRNNLLSLHN